MELNREPTTQEKKLIELLVSKSSLELPDNWKDRLLVRPMDDGGMGSLYLLPNIESRSTQKLGRRVSEYQFTDLDGIEVLVSLNVDEQGNLFELDIWKTNFSPLVKFPKLSDHGK